MSSFPDFSHYGYQIQSELGNNSAGGRVTYLANSIETKQPVVIKQFQFAQLGATWSEYDAYQEEIKVLQSLYHPQIPCYLDSFQTADGFCMVQEYKNAQSLATIRSWTPQQIKQIAISTLNILAYLQRQSTPIIHRDIKPENILIDEQMNVYLVDFGFARMGGGEIAVSSVVKGTLGFMPPEQLFNREITTSSDLYGLGATLICSLTGTKSIDIGSLIDANYYIRFRHLVPPLQRGWMNWLEKMVEPNPKDRFTNAAAALKALETIDITAIPKLRVSRDKLEFTATKFGEKLTQSITISNPIPQTLLAGNWSVAPHKSDPPHTPYEHAWISFNPARFESNEIECKITVDTSKLLANENYSRQILLQTNSEHENYAIDVEVKTAPLLEVPKPNYLLLAGVVALCGFFGSGLEIPTVMSVGDGYFPICALPVLVALFLVLDKIIIGTAEGEVNQIESKMLIESLIGQLSGSVLGYLFSMYSITWPNSINWLVGGCIGAFMLTLIAEKSRIVSFFWLSGLVIMVSLPFIWSYSDFFMPIRTLLIIFIPIYLIGFILVKYVLKHDIKIVLYLIASGQVIIISIFVLLFIGNWIYIIIFIPIYAIFSLVFKYILKHHIKRGYYQREAAQITLLTAGLSICLGFGISTFNTFILPNWFYISDHNLFLIGTLMTILALLFIFPLVNLLIYQPIKRGRFIANYRRSCSHLIKP